MNQGHLRSLWENSDTLIFEVVETDRLVRQTRDGWLGYSPEEGYQVLDDRIVQQLILA